MALVNPTYQNMYQFLKIQRHERYRAFIIHGLPLQGKTRFALRLSQRYPGAVYLNLLDEMMTRPTLATAIDLFDPPCLFHLVVSFAQSTHAQLLLVDDVDFLVHTWADDLQPFKWMIEWLSCNHTPACIGFVLQTRPVLQEWNLINTYGQSRILALDVLSAL